MQIASERGLLEESSGNFNPEANLSRGAASEQIFRSRVIHTRDVYVYNDQERKEFLINSDLEHLISPAQADQTMQNLIVLSAPSIYDQYYADDFNSIVEFQANYARLILENGDKVRVLADADTIPEIEDLFPEGTLMQAEVYDIWMRDFSAINPLDPVQFAYAPAAQAGDAAAAKEVQDSFNSFLRTTGLSPKSTPLILDGGNVVDNHKGRVVVTDRFLEDNNLTYEEGKAELKKHLNATEVAIVPNDDPEGLAHADGMLMFVEENTILLNEYQDQVFLNEVKDELEFSFPGIKIVTVPVDFLNAVLTNETIYIPTFGNQLDEEVLQIVRENTTKNVVPVPASRVCHMGGSVRCLSWHLMGNNANLLD